MTPITFPKPSANWGVVTHVIGPLAKPMPIHSTQEPKCAS